MPMIGSAVGMIKPKATVFVIGTGVAGLRAMQPLSLGAVVYSTDIRPEANEQALSLGAKIIDLAIPQEVTVSKDGKHANKLSQ